MRLYRCTGSLLNPGIHGVAAAGISKAIQDFAQSLACAKLIRNFVKDPAMRVRVVARRCACRAIFPSKQSAEFVAVLIGEYPDKGQCQTPKGHLSLLVLVRGGQSEAFSSDCHPMSKVGRSFSWLWTQFFTDGFLGLGRSRLHNLTNLLNNR